MTLTCLKARHLPLVVKDLDNLKNWIISPCKCCSTVHLFCITPLFSSFYCGISVKLICNNYWGCFWRESLHFWGLQTYWKAIFYHGGFVIFYFLKAAPSHRVLLLLEKPLLIKTEKYEALNFSGSPVILPQNQLLEVPFAVQPWHNSKSDWLQCRESILSCYKYLPKP